MSKLTKEEQALYWENLSKELEENSSDRKKHLMLDIVIPEGITIIPDDVFYKNYYIKSVVIPKSIKRLGPYTFFGCYNLEKVELHENISSIGKWSFINTRISEIYLSDKITTIGEKAFSGCSYLKKITLPSRLKIISKGCFSCCGLEEVVLPKNLERISFSAFSGCQYLAKINLNEINPFIESSAFDYCISLSEDKDFVVINGCLYRSRVIFKPGEIELPSCVKVISSYAFSISEEEYGEFARKYNYTPFCTKIIVPESVIKIESDSFSGSMFLKEIEFRCKLDEIPAWAFSYSKRLRKITVHEKTKISKIAYDCYETLEDRKIKIKYWK